MARSFKGCSKRFYLNTGLLIFMLIINEEIFSSICLTIYAGQVLVWLFKNLPKNY